MKILTQSLAAFRAQCLLCSEPLITILLPNSLGMIAERRQAMSQQALHLCLSPCTSTILNIVASVDLVSHVQMSSHVILISDVFQSYPHSSSFGSIHLFYLNA